MTPAQRELQQHRDVLAAVEPLPRGGLGRADPGKLGLPVAEHVGLDPDEGMLREARRLAAERGVDAPIICAVAQILDRSITIQEAVSALMSRGDMAAQCPAIQAYARNLFDDKTPVGILRYIDRGPGVAKAPTGDSNRAFAITPSRKPEFGLTVTQTF